MSINESADERVVVIEEKPEPKRLYRSRTNSIIAGVCGGLGEFLGIDPALVRLLWLLATLMGGAGILAYIVLALVIPEEPIEHARRKRASPGWGAGWQRGIYSTNAGLLIGLALILFGGILLLDNLGLIPGFLYDMWRLFWRLFWPLLLISLGIVLVIGLSGQTWRQRSGRSLRRSRDRIIAGVCGGLGEYLGVDPTLIRVLWVFATLVSFGLGVLVYLALMVVMPEPNGSITRPGGGL